MTLMPRSDPPSRCASSGVMYSSKASAAAACSNVRGQKLRICEVRALRRAKRGAWRSVVSRTGDALIGGGYYRGGSRRRRRRRRGINPGRHVRISTSTFSNSFSSPARSTSARWISSWSIGASSLDITQGVWGRGGRKEERERERESAGKAESSMRGCEQRNRSRGEETRF